MNGHIVQTNKNKRQKKKLRKALPTFPVKHSYRRRLSVEDDHLQKINEVRESVRQKRMEEKGIVYLEPSLVSIVTVSIFSANNFHLLHIVHSSVVVNFCLAFIIR